MTEEKNDIPDADIARLTQEHSIELPELVDSDEPIGVIPQEEREVEDRPAPPWQSLNPLFNDRLAKAQRVEIGSWEWMQAGMAARSGDSGEQSSYGWRFTHRLNDNYRRAVISNYAARPVYYRNAKFRQFPYVICGRPHGWVPEEPGDHPRGYRAYESSRGTIKVSGPDAEHYWLSPLFALIDDLQPILIDTGLGWQMPSNVAARTMASLLVSAAVATVRDRDGDGIAPYRRTYNDRATFRLMHTMIEGLRRNLLLPEDVPTAAAYVGGIVLPFLERAPGVHSFGQGRPGEFPIGLFNGIWWTVPAVYDAYDVLRRRTDALEWTERFELVLERLARWVADMNKVLPVRCFDGDRLFVDNDFMNGTDANEPVPSLEPFISPKSFHFSFPFADWAFRCVDICANVSGDAGLSRTRVELIERFANTSKKQWMVGADGEYVS